MSSADQNESGEEISIYEKMLAQRVMIATEAEMYDNRVPLYARDFCAHKLLPLNYCREQSYFMPWMCKDERHEYERCQYNDWLLRQHAAIAIKAREKAAREKAVRDSKLVKQPAPASE